MRAGLHCAQLACFWVYLLHHVSAQPYRLPPERARPCAPSHLYSTSFGHGAPSLLWRAPLMFYVYGGALLHCSPSFSKHTDHRSRTSRGFFRHHLRSPLLDLVHVHGGRRPAERWGLFPRVHAKRLKNIQLKIFSVRQEPLFFFSALASTRSRLFQQVLIFPRVHFHTRITALSPTRARLCSSVSLVCVPVQLLRCCCCVPHTISCRTKRFSLFLAPPTHLNYLATFLFARRASA